MPSSSRNQSVRRRGTKGASDRLEDSVHGTMHVAIGNHLEPDKTAAVVSMVVGLRARRSGLGHRLGEVAQDRTRARGPDRILVRSDVVRRESHHFDPALGFVPVKPQRVYAKPLGAQHQHDRSG